LVFTPNGLAPWFRSGRHLNDIARAVTEEDFDKAEELLRLIENANFPPPMEAVACMWRGNVALNRGEPEAALKHLNRAETLQPDFPLLHLLRAIAHNQLEQYDQAIVHGRKFVELMGEDDGAYLQIGTALAALDREEEAAVAYRRGLDDYPDSIDNLIGLGAVLPTSGKKELGQRFARMRRFADHLERLADDFSVQEDDEALELLLDAAYERSPKAPIADSLPFYEAELHWLRHEYGPAVRILAKHRKTLLADKARQETFRDRLIRSLIRSKRAAEAVWEVEAAGEEIDFCLAAAAYAAAGDLAGASSALEEALAESYTVQDFYDDPDLGPLLRSEALRSLREKYPEPGKPETNPQP